MAAAEVLTTTSMSPDSAGVSRGKNIVSIDWAIKTAIKTSRALSTG